MTARPSERHTGPHTVSITPQMIRGRLWFVAFCEDCPWTGQATPRFRKAETARDQHQAVTSPPHPILTRTYPAHVKPPGDDGQRPLF